MPDNLISLTFEIAAKIADFQQEDLCKNSIFLIKINRVPDKLS